MKTVKIAGVPEHFNLPWHLCIENGEFEEVGIDLQWIDVPEGTGKMCEMLKEGEVDLAILLSEGIIKSISDENPSSILQKYVESPLIWGIHTSSNSSITTEDELQNKVIAISRYGSGSHLMSVLHAKSKGWDVANLKFKVVHTIEGAIKALSDGEATYFMWEKFMTKPLVDSNIFNRVAEFPTPWPCFVIAGRNDFIATNPYIINQLLAIINTTTEEFKHIPSIDRTLATRYDLKIEDVQAWLHHTHWSQNKLDKLTFEAIQNELIDLEIIHAKKEYKEVVL